MRIWIINHYALPPSSAGGTRHYNLAKQLMQRGHEVLIVAANYNHFSQTYIATTAKIGEVDNTYDVPFIWIPTPAYRGNTLSRFWNMLAFSWKILRKKYLPTDTPPDVIIGSSPHLFSAFSAEKLARRLKIPILLEIRDIWPDTLVDLGRISNRHPLIRLMKSIELRLYKRADRVISLLPAADKYLTKCGVPAEKILWLPNAIDADNLPTYLAPKAPSAFTVMYAGSHGLANDLDTVLDAAKILQEKLSDQPIRILLAGDGPDKLRLMQRVKAENILLIEFINSVPKNEVYTLLNQADVYLMLLKNSPVFRWGISPNKLFDYLLMGRPVIFGVDTPYNPIEKVNAGMSIPPSDPVSLAVAMQKMAKLSKSELSEMGSRGKEFVLQHHNIIHLTTSLENLIQAVI
jgi:glycosyltransferase involved in cell wall biosynthesis